MNNNIKLNLASSGEAIAAQYVTRLGYHVIQQNFNSAYGELDIVAREVDEIVVIEVKTRFKRNLKNAENSISLSKKKKLTLTTLHFLSLYPQYTGLKCRFDAIIIFDFKRDGTYQIEHLKNAFLPIYPDPC